MLAMLLNLMCVLYITEHGGANKQNVEQVHLLMFSFN